MYRLIFTSVFSPFLSPFLFHFQDSVMGGVTEKNLKCYSCQTFFAHKRSLLRHIDVEHRNRRTYECRYCGRSYNRRDNKQSHERSFRHGRDRGNWRDRSEGGVRLAAVLVEEVRQGALVHLARREVLGTLQDLLSSNQPERRT